MDPDIVKADPVYRWKLFAAYGVILAVGALVIPWAWHAFVRYLLVSNPRHTLVAAETAGIGFLLLFIAPAVYVVLIGRRTLSERRWPPKGMKVIYDTRIQDGEWAVARGRRLVWLGAVCIFAVLLGSAATHFIFFKFKTDPMFFLPADKKTTISY